MKHCSRGRPHRHASHYQLQPTTVVFSVAEDYLSQIQQQLRRGNRLPVDAFDRSQQEKISSRKKSTFGANAEKNSGIMMPTIQTLA